MRQLIKNVKLLSIFLLMISFMGCEEEDADLPQVTAGFTYTVNQDLGKVTFINTSENAENYEWNFGDGNSSTEINPTKVYATGQYQVVLKSSNPAGSSDTFEDTVYINIPIPVRLPIDFDTANVRYQDVEVFNGVAFELVDNPDLSGSNMVASKVGQITNAGANFEGFFYNLDAPINLATDKTIKMNFWANAPVDVLLKLEEGTTGPVEILLSHGGTGWEELIFTFSASSASFNRFTFFVDAFGTTAGNFYIDDIQQVPTIDVAPPTITLNGDAVVTLVQGSAFTDPGATATDDIDGDISANIVVGGDTVDVNTVGTYTITYNVSDAAGNAATEVTRTVEIEAPPASPTTSAPVPPMRAAADVISIYGESYTNIAVGNYDPNWGQSGHTQVNTSFDPGTGNLVLAYPNFNYQGTDFGAGGPQNASTMEFLHIDIWVAAGTQRMVKVSPINNGTGAGEVLVEVPVTPGSWNSVDLPKSAFAGMTWDSVVQMKFDGQFNADGSANTDPFDVYLDNIYFYKAPGAATSPTTSAPTPPARNASDVISIYGESYTNITVDNYDPNWGQSGHTQVNTAFDPGTGNLVLAYPNFNYQGTDFGSGGPQDASSMEFLHVDIWVAAGTQRMVKVSPINNGSGAGEVLVEVPLTPGAWNSVDLPKSAFTGMTWDSVVQMKFDGQFNADGSANMNPFDIYLDNIYFYKSGGGSSGSALLDFEDGNAFTGTFDNGANGAIAANPDMSGINTSANVYQFNKIDGSAWYSGMFHIFSSDLDPSAGTTFKVKVWSPNANINFRFQLEKEGNQGPIVTYNIDQPLNQANQWVELTFDFSSTALNLADGYDKIVIFPDYDESNQVPVSPGVTYYIDDVIQE